MASYTERGYMKNEVYFNIVQDGIGYRLSGRVGDESISELHETKQICTERAIEMLTAYKYINREAK